MKNFSPKLELESAMDPQKSAQKSVLVIKADLFKACKKKKNTLQSEVTHLKQTYTILHRQSKMIQCASMDSLSLFFISIPGCGVEELRGPDRMKTRAGSTQYAQVLFFNKNANFNQILTKEKYSSGKTSERKQNTDTDSLKEGQTVHKTALERETEILRRKGEGQTQY